MKQRVRSLCVIGMVMMVGLFGLVPLVPAQTAGYSVTLHNAAAASGNGTMMTVPFLGTVGLQVTGTFSGTLVPSVSHDATNWYPVKCTNTETGTSSASITAAGSYQCPTAGFPYFLAPFTRSSGSVTVYGQATAASSSRGGSVGGGLASSDIDTCAELAAIMGDETGTCGGVVLSQAPTINSPIFTTKMNVPRVTALPGSPSAGDVVVVTDDSATGACDSAAGSAVSQCFFNGSVWIGLGDGGSGGGLTHPQVMARASMGF